MEWINAVATIPPTVPPVDSATVVREWVVAGASVVAAVAAAVAARASLRAATKSSDAANDGRRALEEIFRPSVDVGISEIGGEQHQTRPGEDVRVGVWIDPAPKSAQIRWTYKGAQRGPVDLTFDASGRSHLYFPGVTAASDFVDSNHQTKLESQLSVRVDLVDGKLGNEWLFVCNLAQKFEPVIGDSAWYWLSRPGAMDASLQRK